MNNSWTQTSLGDICMFRAGTAFPKKFQGDVSGEIPFIKVSDLKHSANSLYIRHSANWVDMSTVEHLKASLLYPGAIVFAKIGEGLKAERFRLVARPTCIDNNLMGAIPQGINTHFLYYLMVHTGVAHLVEGSALPYLRQSDLERIPVCVPPNDDQRRIAEVLGALDDKIESNQNLAEVIPSLIDAQIHHELSDGSGDSIPVSKLAKFVNGGAYTKEASGTGRMVIRIADLNTGPGASTIYNDIDVPGDRLAHFGDLLMSWSGSLGVYVWVREEAIVNQHIFKVILTDFPAWLVHNRLNVALHGFRAIAADKATTMGHIQRKHLDETFVEVPIAKLEQLNHLCIPLWNRFVSAQLESMRLAELRDTLLPELMSGRMRVDEAGRMVSEALDEEVADV